MKQILIPIIDNGHGKETKGKRSPVWGDGSQLFEYEFNRDVAKRLCRMMDAAGIEYRLLVPEIWDVSLKARCERANTIYKKFDGRAFLISIHANAGGGTGFECYTSRGETKADLIATVLLEEFRKEFAPEWKMRHDYVDGDPDKEVDFYILKYTTCPAILTESFFMDTEKDCRFIMSEEGRNRIAKAHFETIKKVCYG